MVAGPKNGTMRNGPDPTPQYARVWPKSSSCFGSPIGVDTSKNPTRPMVELKIKREASDNA